MQLTLEGYKVPYESKDGKCFATMSQLKRHHAKKRKKKTSINFVLENYKMISKVEVLTVV